MNVKSAELETLAAVNAPQFKVPFTVADPQFKVPVTAAGPVIVVFVAFTTKVFAPLVIDRPLLPVTAPQVKLPQPNVPLTTAGPPM